MWTFVAVRYVFSYGEGGLDLSDQGRRRVLEGDRIITRQ